MMNTASVRRLDRIVFVVVFLVLASGISHSPVLAQYTRFQQPVWHPYEDIIALSNGVSIRLYNGDFSQILNEFELTTVRNPFIQNTAIAWSPDGTMLGVAIQGSDIVPALQIWDIQNGQLVAQIPDIDPSATFAWGFESNQVALIHERGLGDVVIRIHNVPDVDTFVEFDLDDELGYIEHIAWSPDGQEIAATKDGRLYLVDVQTGQVRISAVFMYAGFESPRFAFSPDSQYLLGVTDPNAIEATILNTSTDEIAGVLADGTYRILTVTWNKHNIITVSLDGVTRLWDSSTFEAIAVFQTGITSKPSFSPDGGVFVASANDYETILVRSSETGHIIASLDPIDDDTLVPTITSSSTAPINRIDWNADGTRLAAVRNDGTLTVYDQSLAFVNEFTISEDSLTSVEWHPMLNDQLAVSTTFGEIFVIDVHSTPFEVVQTFGPEINHVRKVRWSPDGLFLATIGETGGGASSESALHVWDMATGTMVSAYVPFFSLTDLAWNPKNTNELLVTGVQDNAGTPMLLWNPFTGSILWYVEQETGVIYIAWEPSGQKFAAFTEAYEAGGAILAIHDAANGDLLQTLPTGLMRRSTIMWEPNQLLAVLGERGIQIWDVDKAEMVASLNPEDLGVEFAWKPDALDQLTYLTSAIEHITLPSLSQTPTAAP